MLSDLSIAIFPWLLKVCGERNSWDGVWNGDSKTRESNSLIFVVLTAIVKAGQIVVSCWSFGEMCKGCLTCAEPQALLQSTLTSFHRSFHPICHKPGIPWQRDADRQLKRRSPLTWLPSFLGEHVSCKPLWCCTVMSLHLVSSYEGITLGTLHYWWDSCCCSSRLHVFMLAESKEYVLPFFSIVFCFQLLCLLLLTWHLTRSGHFYLVKVIVLQQSHSKQGMTEFKGEHSRKKCITAMANPDSFHQDWKLCTVSKSPTHTPVCFRDILKQEFVALFI